MFKLARLTDYAVVLLLDLCLCDGAVQSALSLSRRTSIPLPTVQKILRQLRCGRDPEFLTSQRGKAGGYSLAVAPHAINLADILRIMEGEVALTACVDGAEGSCIVEQVCSVRGRWDMVNRAVKEALSSLTLADMMEAESASLPFMAEREAFRFKQGANYGN